METNERAKPKKAKTKSIKNNPNSTQPNPTKQTKKKPKPSQNQKPQLNSTQPTNNRTNNTSGILLLYNVCHIEQCHMQREGLIKSQSNINVMNCSMILHVKKETISISKFC